MVHLKLVKQEIEAEKPASVEAQVISVKFKKGCYRHIQIPKTLAELADVILWSFDFASDHAHAFFMDNVAWSHADSYFLSFVSDDVEERYTENVYLDILSVKQKFKFIFDFGDEWRFECQVLREIEIEDEEAYLVCLIGTPPEQYPDYDGFDGEEWQSGQLRNKK